ncbi:MAG: ribonuclease P protein component [Flavobacteriales bacterium]|nr:ribonuclease P protein component [Flavobacteriales bacterium]
MICSLKSKKKIDLIFEKGVSVKSTSLQIKSYDFKDSEIKFGVSVPKKLFPSSVKRNLLKRRLREQVKNSGFIGAVKPGVSFFVIYHSKNILPSTEIKQDLEILAQKL